MTRSALLAFTALLLAAGGALPVHGAQGGPGSTTPLAKAWHAEWGPQAPGLLRFNRVEGLSVGMRGSLRLSRVDAALVARVGYGDWEPNAELVVERRSLLRTMTLRSYHGLTTVAVGHDALSIGNSLSTLVLGRDEGDYYRVSGIEVTLQSPKGRGTEWSLGLFGERQRMVVVGTRASLPRLFDDARRFRPTFSADEIDVMGARLRLRPWWGGDPLRPEGGFDFFAEGAVGDQPFVRASVATGMAVPLPSRLRLGLHLGAGHARGDSVPLQSHWFLGGARTLRGYAGASAVGVSMMRARAQLARAFSFGAVTLFGDAGWAGGETDDPERSGLPFHESRVLYSTGAGFSILDGLIRVDLARALRPPTDWRIEFYLDAVL